MPENIVREQQTTVVYYISSMPYKTTDRLPIFALKQKAKMYILTLLFPHATQIK